MKRIDITGQKFNFITVISVFGYDPQQRLMWNCVCDCGKNFVAKSNNLRTGNTKSCGCRKYSSSLKPLFGKKFGRLTVTNKYPTINKKGVAHWECICDCGSIIAVTTGHLQSQHTKSCGCLLIEFSKENIKKLNGKKGKEHQRWNNTLTEKDRAERRNSLPSKIWRKSVYKRDNYKCDICGITPNKLNAHHLNSWKYNKELRFDVNNGITLCVKHHKAFHSSIKGMKGKCTSLQYFLWKDLLNVTRLR